MSEQPSQVSSCFHLQGQSVQRVPEPLDLDTSKYLSHAVMAWHARRLESSSTLLWEPEISQNYQKLENVLADKSEYVCLQCDLGNVGPAASCTRCLSLLNVLCISLGNYLMFIRMEHAIQMPVARYINIHNLNLLDNHQTKRISSDLVRSVEKILQLTYRMWHTVLFVNSWGGGVEH